MNKEKLNKRQIIIFGSSRKTGNTKKALNQITGENSIDLVDLNDIKISPFDYEHQNRDDDFIPLIKKIVNYDRLIIATPIYWYSMSSQHKMFFDRFTDLLTIEKDLGRKLRGKELFVIASFGSSYPKGFEDTFEQICNYLGIKYLGSSFIYGGKEKEEFLQENAIYIAKAKSALEIL